MKQIQNWKDKPKLLTVCKENFIDAHVLWEENKKFALALNVKHKKESMRKALDNMNILKVLLVFKNIINLYY